MKPSILIVNGEEEVRRRIREEFSSEDYQLREARDGRDALTRVRRRPPDLIILDLIMPGPDGFTVLSRWRAGEKTARIPVIFFVEQEDEIYPRLARSLGASGLVTYRQGINKLMGAVEKILPPGRTIFDRTI